MQRSVRVFSTNSARRTLTRYAPTGVEEEVWPPCQGVKGCVNEVSGRTHDAHALWIYRQHSTARDSPTGACGVRLEEL
jgi:hypothetical protein